jgi:hypothetical protein
MLILESSLLITFRVSGSSCLWACRLRGQGRGGCRRCSSALAERQRRRRQARAQPSGEAADNAVAMLWMIFMIFMEVALFLNQYG